MKENYQNQLDALLERLSGDPKLLLHSCCAPCSGYVLDYLAGYFPLTVYFYNPNIYPEREYQKRKSEQLRLIASARFRYPVSFLDADYSYSLFLEKTAPLGHLPEGGARCEACFRLRLEQTAAAAAKGGFRFFGTTLTVSPHKNAEAVNRIGQALAERYSLRWLPGDFKKKGGYQKSVTLSKRYGLYRQNYCGCEFSLPKEAL